MDEKNPHPASVTISPDRVQATGMTLRDLIKISYDLNYGADRQVSGGPAWIDSTRFDVDAKEDPSLSAKLQNLPQQQREDLLRQMLRQMLADRFMLQIHHASREFAIYELVTAKGGSKLVASAPPPASSNEDGPAKPRSSIRFAGKGVLDANEADSLMLVTALSTEPEIGGRLVVDKTGLTGKYDFILKWTPDMGQGAGQPAADAGPSLFTALQEQLGLKLEPTRAPVDIIVVDRAELPSAN